MIFATDAMRYCTWRSAGICAINVLEQRLSSSTITLRSLHLGNKLEKKMEWKALPQTLHSPDLPPAQYPLFEFVKDQIRGPRFKTIKKIKAALRHCLQKARTKLHRRVSSKYQNGGKCVCKKVETMWKSKESTAYSHFEHSFSVIKHNMS